jgi:hypothetical protein
MLFPTLDPGSFGGSRDEGDSEADAGPVAEGLEPAVPAAWEEAVRRATAAGGDFGAVRRRARASTEALDAEEAAAGGAQHAATGFFR